MVNTCESTGPFDQRIYHINRYLISLADFVNHTLYGTWNSFFWGGQVEWWWTMGYVCSLFLNHPAATFVSGQCTSWFREFFSHFSDPPCERFYPFAQVQVEGRNFHTGDTETWVICGFIDSWFGRNPCVHQFCYNIFYPTVYRGVNISKIVMLGFSSIRIISKDYERNLN